MLKSEFPTDFDFLAEINQLSNENEALYETRDILQQRVDEKDKKLRNIRRLLDEIWKELR
jgi:hypothetical protein